MEELRDEGHGPMMKFVSALSRESWASGLDYDLSMLRLWIARKGVGRVEVMVTYGDGRKGGRPLNLDLDAYELTIFAGGGPQEAVIRNLHDTIDRIGAWLEEATPGPTPGAGPGSGP
jgi:hypothetical protein